nr:zinc finger protein 254-like [Biomphalaria glabrata]
MDDIKDYFTELKNFIKIEKIEQSLDSEMTDNSYMYQTSKLGLEEQIQKYEEQMHSMPMMEDLKQDFTNDLCKVMKNEKTELSLHPETSDSCFIGQTRESILSDKTEEINQNRCMSYNQDKPRNSPNKDGHAGNFKDEEQNSSNENGTLQLVSAAKQFSKNHGLMHSSRKTFKFSASKPHQLAALSLNTAYLQEYLEGMSLGFS